MQHWLTTSPEFSPDSKRLKLESSQGKVKVVNAEEIMPTHRVFRRVTNVSLEFRAAAAVVVFPDWMSS